MLAKGGAEKAAGLLVATFPLPNGFAWFDPNNELAAVWACVDVAPNNDFGCAAEPNNGFDGVDVEFSGMTNVKFDCSPDELLNSSWAFCWTGCCVWPLAVGCGGVLGSDDVSTNKCRAGRSETDRGGEQMST